MTPANKTSKSVRSDYSIYLQQTLVKGQRLSFYKPETCPPGPGDDQAHAL